MKVNLLYYHTDNNIIDLHDQTWLEKQRISGQVVSGCLKMLEGLIKSGTQKTLKELDNIAGEYIRDHNCSETFYNYKGFPGKICISVNETLVHGVPTDYRLQDGDLITFDLGATFEGVISDAARTMVYGNYKKEEHKLLIETTKECLKKAIENISIGKKLGIIGETIYTHAKNKGFSVVDNYGGHSLTHARENPNIGIPHAPPFISNKDICNNGIRIVPGLTLAIEPLLVIGNSNKTTLRDDNWSVYTENIGCHFEDTIFITENGVEIMTR